MRTGWMRTVGIAVGGGLVAGALALAGATAAQADETTSTGPLRNASKLTFLAGNGGAWIDSSFLPGTVTYPKPGQTSVVTVDGTCVAYDADPGLGVLATQPVGDGSDCLRFTAEATPAGLISLRVDTPGAPAHGRYLGDGDNGDFLDLISTEPSTLFAIPTAAVLFSAPEDGATVATRTPVLSGTGEPNATVVVTDSSGTVIGTTTVNANGTWSLSPTEQLPEGNNALTATQDIDGDISIDHVNFLIVEEAPEVPIVAPLLAVSLGVAGLGIASAGLITRRKSVNE